MDCFLGNRNLIHTYCCKNCLWLECSNNWNKLTGLAQDLSVPNNIITLWAGTNHKNMDIRRMIFHKRRSKDLKGDHLVGRVTRIGPLRNSSTTLSRLNLGIWVDVLSYLLLLSWVPKFFLICYYWSVHIVNIIMLNIKMKIWIWVSTSAWTLFEINCWASSRFELTFPKIKTFVISIYPPIKGSSKKYW